MTFPRDLSTRTLPQETTSNFINPESLASLILDLGVILIVLTIIFVLIRLYSNYNATRGLGWDDLFCVVATILLLTYIATCISVRKWARHNEDVSLSSIHSWEVKKFSVMTLLGAPMMFFAKTSIFLLYYRVFAPKKLLRYIIIIGIACCFAVYSMSLAVEVYFCAPHIGQKWDLWVHMRCAKAGLMTTITGAANLALDIFMLGLPIPVILHLQLPFKKKMMVLAMFMTGLLIFITSTCTLVYKIRLIKSPSNIWTGFEVVICQIVETGVTIVCSSMPAFASFSKPCAVHSTYFDSLLSHFPSLFPFSISKAKPNSSASSDTRTEPFPASQFKAHSSSHQQILFGFEEHRGPDRYPLNRTTTEIQGAACSDDIENGIIMKSVTVLQSST